jgi:hypothetical protein
MSSSVSWYKTNFPRGGVVKINNFPPEANYAAHKVDGMIKNIFFQKNIYIRVGTRAWAGKNFLP